jgi:hypothetical protein
MLFPLSPSLHAITLQQHDAATSSATQRLCSAVMNLYRLVAESVFALHRGVRQGNRISKHLQEPIEEVVVPVCTLELSSQGAF